MALRRGRYERGTPHGMPMGMSTPLPRRTLLPALAASCLAACATHALPAASPATAAPAVEPATADTDAADTGAAAGAVDIPEVVPSTPLAHRVVASGLLNPRGLHELPDGALLVSEAGTGDPANPGTGRLLRLRDVDGDGDFDDAGERTALLQGMRSTNIIDIVRRDEVFGMADIAAGDGKLLVTHAFFGMPTTVYAVEGDRATEWGAVHANLNALTFDAGRKRWFAASSSSDELVEVHEGGGQRRVLKFPPLAQGQDAVPGYLEYEPESQRVLVSLFSGSPEGEEGGSGIELVRRAGLVVRVDPDTGETVPAITGLTAPTDLVLDTRGRVYILELCDGFVDPIETREAMGRVGHGGFRRFSGRLLRVDLRSGEVRELATGLDTPTNLSLAGNRLYIALGMGTPGRQIPGPAGAVGLDGRIVRVDLPED